MTKKQATYQILVCVDCMLTREQGELPPDIAEGVEPWSEYEGEAVDITKGSLDPDYDEESEGEGFHTSRCDGCGSSLAGSRYVYTVWERA